MKKNVLYPVMLSFLSSVTYAMGLGDIKVSSYLDQPFSADIELIDVGNTPLSGIKANLASVADFERVGLERAYALTLLTFNVEKRSNGKTYIKVRSTERITDPFMQLLVDLAWSEGQVYRSYTILLDPPNYQISVVKNQLKNIVKRQYGTQNHDGNNIIYSQVKRAPSPTENRKVATYGPTLANETIWQIAQHYKTGDVSLQQIILAIVGTNPQAFTEGNLNGLKSGSRLQIPASSTISKVPLSVAKFEVLAHDKAWQTRQPIEHVLLPPYIDTVTLNADDEPQDANDESLSIIPPIPIPGSADGTATPSQHFLPSMPALFSGGDYASPNGMPQSKSGGKQEGINANIDIAAAAIKSVREVNALLIKEMQKLRVDNKRLHEQVEQHTKEMKQLRSQLSRLLAQQGLAGKNSKQSTEGENSLLPWILLILLLAGGGFVYWKLWIRPRKNLDGASSQESAPTLDPTTSVATTEKNDNASNVSNVSNVSDEVIENEKNPISEEPQNSVSTEAVNSGKEQQEIADVSDQPVENVDKVIDDKMQQEAPVEDEHVFEYEPIPVDEQAETNEIQDVKELSDDKDDNSIDFVLNPVNQTSSRKEAMKPLKSKAALDTLLALAKTYIGMDDIEAAKQSLHEVLDFGSKTQKSEAKRLLDELDKK